MMTSSKHSISGGSPARWEAKIHVSEPGVNPGEPFEYIDYLTATWGIYHTDDEQSPPAGYWLISGDNTGSQQLVVHPYMIPALIDLLRKLADESPKQSA